jgi:4-hydroxythreonine-4-phosphate dehydrogenase
MIVTMGDPAGIGLDITLKAYVEKSTPPFILYADPSTVFERAKQLGFTINITEANNADNFNSSLPVRSLKSRVKSAKPSAENAESIIESITEGVKALYEGQAKAIITNPIAKYILKEAGFKHPGHTEFLGELAEKFWGKPVFPVMLLWSETLAVIPITIHIPLKDVPNKLTTELILNTARIAARDFETRFNIKPRMVFCGLNPHAGDGGVMGLEDEAIIRPALHILRDEGHDVSGPHSADTLFHARARINYDLAFGMYHDQVLIPIKTLAFDDGVNVTLGLPFLRTSPDHGTAFDIAGTGKANPSSFIAAVQLAARLA